MTQIQDSLFPLPGLGKWNEAFIPKWAVTCIAYEIETYEVTYGKYATNYRMGYCVNNCNFRFWQDSKRVLVEKWTEEERRGTGEVRRTTEEIAAEALAGLACAKWNDGNNGITW